MKRAGLNAHDRALLAEVRELLRALAAHLSLDLDDRSGDSRKAVASAGNASPAPSHTPAAAGSLSVTEGVAHPPPHRHRGRTPK